VGFGGDAKDKKERKEEKIFFHLFGDGDSGAAKVATI
jgi:hypothetical protein